jgi:hypothetical protein
MSTTRNEYQFVFKPNRYVEEILLYKIPQDANSPLARDVAITRREDHGMFNGVCSYSSKLYRINFDDEPQKKAFESFLDSGDSVFLPDKENFAVALPRDCDQAIVNYLRRYMEHANRMALTNCKFFAYLEKPLKISEFTLTADFIPHPQQK